MRMFRLTNCIQIAVEDPVCGLHKTERERWGRGRMEEGEEWRKEGKKRKKEMAFKLESRK